MGAAEPDRLHRFRLQRWACWVAAAAVAPLAAPARALSGAGAAPGGRARSERLVVHYSRTGHTRQAALAVARAVGADVFEIVPAAPVPAGYQDTVDLNMRQRAVGTFPPAPAPVPDLDRYGIVFLGYPIWAVNLPRLLPPFLAAQSFDDKVIAPFCTSAMSGLADTENAIRRLCPRARVVPGLSLPGGGRGHNAQVTRIAADARQRAERWAVGIVA